jgi:hypothetical protein
MNMNAYFQMCRWMHEAISAEKSGDHNCAARYLDMAIMWEARI